MRRGENPGTTANTTSQGQFRTPDKPSRIRPTTGSNASKGASARTDPPASSASTSRSWKRSTVPDLRDQTTLTQIDFVTPISQDPESNDDDLDYIGDRSRSRPQKSHEVIEIDDDSDHDADYEPSSRPQPHRIRGVKFEQGAKDAGSKQKRRSSQGGGEKKQKRRKSGEGSNTSKKDKDKAKGHKTLTQMDYVRRYLKIEPDDDMKLEYTYINPKKSDDRTMHSKDTGDQIPQNGPQQGLSERKMRKLKNDPGAAIATEAAKDQARISGDPVTPQKRLKFEIPSSQSPESPGIAIITSSQFHSATRSPREHVSARLASRCIKEESPTLNRIKEESIPESEPMLQFPDDSLTQSVVPNSPLSNRNTASNASTNAPAGQSESPKKPTLFEETTETLHDKECPANTQRTVIYETDAETDYGDLEEELPDAPGSPTPEPVGHGPTTGDLAFDSSKEDSQDQDLPPMNPSELDVETEPPLPELNPASESSIYYQRMPATQFPLGTIPTLSSQRLAELFPEDSSDQLLKTMSPLPSSPRTESHPMPKPDLPVIGQTQAQNAAKTPTEVVPESSPITRHGNSTKAKGLMPPEPLARRDVVQVESSQPADRLHKQNKEDSSGPRGILSGSQILTSSVMESVPLPAFLMDSQDSVGEPYSLPDS
ncbi:hypothetical protein BO94DRAFT_540297 [Aspergillus sclerotioniger CBS 115572]|uniref:Uncharacterized protein n=1 Tax=Aspergillus sclerotioniger CBS 115572 TaxID=1450535 RepID=A0A317V5G5_9EURO|nr:hypothetical protein BO94DRAFT_540297 [Aspergillus sclerotioniger CBS 115572]PWY68102.1 hypothetical protein BO94DRAFT_540297 [Aspergillus sclerotioniger CBS 115572]